MTFPICPSRYIWYTYAHMSLSIGIVGLPNVGKSTLFNALTDAEALAANYPFATIEPNTGIVPVPDSRLSTLSKLYHDAPIKPATVEFVDIAGLVAGASKGEGLGNQFLANIRECDAIVHVVRAFENRDILRHDNGAVNPKKDIDVINTELILADLQTLEKYLPKLEKEVKGDPKKRPELERLREIQTILDSGRFPSHDLTISRSYDLALLTAKPIIYAFNVDEETLTDEKKQSELCQIVSEVTGASGGFRVTDSASSPNPVTTGVRCVSRSTGDGTKKQQDDVIFICAKLEEELKGLDESDRLEMLESYGVKESGLVQLVTAAYHTLGLQSYLTAGDKEVRAWTIKKGATAPEAAGVIHTDFEKGFIAAQIMDYNDLIAAGSDTAVKAAGKMHTVGRDYVMQPDDIVEFRFNVKK